MTSENRNCQNCKNQFTIEPDDFQFYEKISAQGGSSFGGKVPAPIWCQYPNFLHLNAINKDYLYIANHRKFYKRKCHRCLKEIDSVYPEIEFSSVYCQTCYNSEIV